MINIVYKKSLKSFLKQYGMFVEETNDGLAVIDSYPAFPFKEERKIIIKVNNKNPYVKGYWVKGENLVKFLNGEEVYVNLDEYNWETIKYNNIILEKILILQCCHFSNIEALKVVSNSIEYLILDLRINFGSSIGEMNAYYNEMMGRLDRIKFKKLYILVSNTTCSSAELFVDRISKLKNVIIVGSDTYQKKYAYSVITQKDRWIYIPKYRIKTEFTINEYIGFYYYYNIRTLNKKKVYIHPEVWFLEEDGENQKQLN